MYSNLRHNVQSTYSYVGDVAKDWGQLSRLLQENNINALHYMRWIWNFYTRHRPIAYVTMINSPKSVKIYMDEAPYKEEDRINELKLKLDIQTDIVLTEISCGRSIRDILVDENLALGTVMRYALSYTGGFADLVQTFRAEAERELLWEPLYLTLLEDKLPPGDRRGGTA